MGADRHARAGRGRSRSPAAADARRRPHRPHAGAHLSARRPPRRRDRVEPAGGQGRRGLHRAVPRAGALSARLLPAQPPLHLDGRDARADAGTLALESAQKLAAAIPQEALGSVPILQGFLVVPYWAMVRFGEWDGILSDKGPRHETPFTSGVVALRARDGAHREGPARRRRAGAARSWRRSSPTRRSRDRRRSRPTPATRSCASRPKWWPARSRRSGRTGTRAILHLDRAVRYEDALIYQEPPDWHAPVRQNLGRGAARRGPRRRSRGRLLGGPEEEPGERLVAVRARCRR